MPGKRIPDKVGIGAWLEAERKRHGQHSREQVAHLVQTTARTVYDWEKGKSSPPADKFFALVALYGAAPQLRTLLNGAGGPEGLAVHDATAEARAAAANAGRGRRGKSTGT